jgi:Urease accessory protein UreH
MIDFSTAPEMAPYLTEPKAMHVDAPGKSGYLNLGFELDKNGKSILRDLKRHVPLIVQQELYFDEEMPEIPCVYILSSGGPNIDGDRYEQNILVRKGAYAFVSTGAATKLAEMRYNYSGLKQTFVLEDDSYLEFLPEQVIPCQHTRFISDTLLRVAPTATLFYAEIFTSGRKYYKDGERFKYDVLSVSTHGERSEQEPLFNEKFLIRPKMQSPQIIGCMDDFDVFANVIVMTPQKKADKVYQEIKPYINKKTGLAVGISHLPNDCGLVYKVLGNDADPVKKTVRSFCSKVRMAIKGKPLPDDFPWR